MGDSDCDQPASKRRHRQDGRRKIESAPRFRPDCVGPGTTALQLSTNSRDHAVLSLLDRRKFVEMFGHPAVWCLSGTAHLWLTFPDAMLLRGADERFDVARSAEGDDADV